MGLAGHLRDFISYGPILHHPQPLSPGFCVIIPFLSLRANAESVAISLFPTPCEIASVVSLPRNDIAIQSPAGRGEREGLS